MLNRELLDDSDSGVVNLVRRRQMAGRAGVTDDKVKEVREIMGSGPSDMDVIRALYQSKNDVSSAVNILFDTRSWNFKRPVAVKRGRAAVASNPSPANAPPAPDIEKPTFKELPKPSPGNGSGSRENTPLGLSQSPYQVPSLSANQSVAGEVVKSPSQARARELSKVPAHANLPLNILDSSVSKDSLVLPNVHSIVQPDSGVGATLSVPLVPTRVKDPQLNAPQLNTPQVDVKPPIDVIDLTQPTSKTSKPSLPGPTVYKQHPKNVESVTTLKKRHSDCGLDSPQFLEEFAIKVDSQSLYTKSLLQLQVSWKEDLVLLGQSSVICLSTCKGKRLSPGDELMFSFPKSVSEALDNRRGWGRGKGAVATSEIVRFSTEKTGEIGRLPGEWARNLIPLVSSKKVAISGLCADCPSTLGLLDSITLHIGIFVSRSLLKKYSASPSSTSVSAEISTHNPLLSVLRLLGKKPFMKAEFTPEDLYNRKRSLDSDMAKKNGACEPILPSDKRQKLSSGASAVPGEENEAEEISEADLNKIVGTSEGSELMEMDAPSTIVCDLRPYQKQALFWMTKMETGRDLEEAAKSLHPCWEAYYLGDEKSVFYVNVFSGDSSVDFPSALQTSRGGILADAMGLGKTVMGIALLAASLSRGGGQQICTPCSNAHLSEGASETNTDLGAASQIDDSVLTQTSSVKRQTGSRDAKGKQRGGGTLIVCPMTLLGQWKTELETHVKPGVLSVLTYYGQDRMKDSKSLLDYDVVLTTYGVLTSDNNQNYSGGGIVQGIHWHRIMLDEAHTIKNLRSQASQAIFKLTADCRWCLTGTPIQVWPMMYNVSTTLNHVTFCYFHPGDGLFVHYSTASVAQPAYTRNSVYGIGWHVEGMEGVSVFEEHISRMPRSKFCKAEPKVENNELSRTYNALSALASVDNVHEASFLCQIATFKPALEKIFVRWEPLTCGSMATRESNDYIFSRIEVRGLSVPQNKLEDVFSLLHFLRIEPWGNLGWWTKLIQKPFDEGDERGLKLLQAILKPLMLRRTKETVDKEGRPIIVLPPADVQVIECELSEAERDFYEALFKKSKVKFDMFVEQGKVLHNYASILELLLRLRQCCDHPFLVMSRGDTDEFADLSKLARHFMEGVSRSGDGPTRAFVEEVVNEFRKGERAECPICLEVMEDAVLTSCAHSMCRECLFASWPSYGGGSCPICRQYVTRQELITAPKESRFHLDVEKNWRASSKVMALMKELEKVKLLGEKSVVFSQWTSFLDLLQIPLKREKFSYVRLDGSLSQQQREQVIRTFGNDPKIQVMLISLKSGGVGVNLTAASHAFLLDPWWNPAVEEQAIMRIHRIGQVRNVFIKRFICKDTVEQRMQLVQARKQRMIAGALNNQEVRAARLEELKMLFR